MLGNDARCHQVCLLLFTSGLIFVAHKRPNSHAFLLGLVNDFNTDEFEDAVDQYEFAVASLLTLGLVSHDDLAPIMDKFRELAGADGYINVEKETEVKETNEINQKILERAKSRKLSVADLKETSA